MNARGVWQYGLKRAATVLLASGTSTTLEEVLLPIWRETIRDTFRLESDFDDEEERTLEQLSTDQLRTIFQDGNRSYEEFCRTIRKALAELQRRNPRTS
ncbi:MAG: hypothetical protein ABIG71_02765 [Candidatus Uhrbacteria bacterium]